MGMKSVPSAMKSRPKTPAPRATAPAGQKKSTMTTDEKVNMLLGSVKHVLSQKNLSPKVRLIFEVMRVKLENILRKLPPPTGRA